MVMVKQIAALPIPVFALFVPKEPEDEKDFWIERCDIAGVVIDHNDDTETGPLWLSIDTHSYELVSKEENFVRFYDSKIRAEEAAEHLVETRMRRKEKASV
jgi:hypothetical protein